MRVIGMQHIYTDYPTHRQSPLLTLILPQNCNIYNYYYIHLHSLKQPFIILKSIIKKYYRERLSTSITVNSIIRHFMYIDNV